MMINCMIAVTQLHEIVCDISIYEGVWHTLAKIGMPHTWRQIGMPYTECLHPRKIGMAGSYPRKIGMLTLSRNRKHALTKWNATLLPVKSFTES